MRKNLLQFSLIATILLFGACSNEELLTETNPEVNRTMSLTISMPDVGPSTRVNLEKDGNNIVLKWVVGDVIQLAYVQGAYKAFSTVTVTSVSADGKKANFLIPISPEDAAVSSPFTLYGVYGGGGIDKTTTNPVAILPTNAGDAGSLAGVQGRNDVMLFFKKDMQTTDTQASVSFNHLGSLFNLNLKNLGDIPANIASEIKEVRLVGVNNTGNVNWAFNNNSGSQGFDLVSGVFLNQSTAGNYISFKPGETASSVWGWYPILPGNSWPQLQLELIDINGNNLTTSTNFKSGRVPVLGKSYNFYVEWINGTLNFVP